MNKKNVVTKENIAKVADFLKEACDYFQKQGEGCFNFNLSEDLVLAVGWSDGYNMADEDIIKSKRYDLKKSQLLNHHTQALEELTLLLATEEPRAIQETDKAIHTALERIKQATA